MSATSEAAYDFWAAVTGRNRELEAHHAIPKRILKRIARSRGLKDGSPGWLAIVYDARVGVALPPRVHERHTTHVARIPLEHLPVRVCAAAVGYGREAVSALLAEHPPLDPEAAETLWGALESADAR